MKFLVTGGAGFIGGNFAHYMVNTYPEDQIVVLDLLTYAGNLETLEPIMEKPNFKFVKGDIRDRELIDHLFAEEKFDMVVNFAAETHVDRSVEDPEVFITTNILGTQVLMDACRKYGIQRYHQVSTDEVYGDLPLDRPDLFFTEETPIHTSSPYSAAKAGADLLVQAYHRTFKLPVTISRCSNNYGPYHFPEKLIPLMAGLYIVGCIVICVINGAHIPAAFAAIVKGAFNPAAAGGGFVGATVVACIRAGVSRGLFTNESGLGSAPIVDACAATRNTSRQALISMSGVFWDTIVVCLMTGLVLVSSIIKDPVGMEGLVGANMTAGAFNAIPIVGPAVLTFGLITFAWSTILGWAYYGERAWVYLVGVEAIKPFRVAWTIVVLVGCSATLEVVWNVADTLNACMAFPNLIALLGLSGVIASETKKYVWDKDAEMGGLMKWMDDVAPSVDK